MFVGDTGGLLADDWITPEAYKLQLIHRLCPDPSKIEVRLADMLLPVLSDNRWKETAQSLARLQFSEFLLKFIQRCLHATRQVPLYSQIWKKAVPEDNNKQHNDSLKCCDMPESSKGYLKCCGALVTVGLGN